MFCVILFRIENCPAVLKCPLVGNYTKDQKLTDITLFFKVNYIELIRKLGSLMLGNCGLSENSIGLVWFG